MATAFSEEAKPKTVSQLLVDAERVEGMARETRELLRQRRRLLDRYEDDLAEVATIALVKNRPVPRGGRKIKLNASER
jgi:hypothetical protein